MFPCGCRRVQTNPMAGLGTPLPSQIIGQRATGLGFVKPPAYPNFGSIPGSLKMPAPPSGDLATVLANDATHIGVRAALQRVVNSYNTMPAPPRNRGTFHCRGRLRAANAQCLQEVRREVAVAQNIFDQKKSLLDEEKSLKEQLKNIEKTATARITANIPYKGWLIRPKPSGDTLLYEAWHHSKGSEGMHSTIPEAQAIIDVAIAQEEEAQRAAALQPPALVTPSTPGTPAATPPPGVTTEPGIMLPGAPGEPAPPAEGFDVKKLIPWAVAAGAAIFIIR